jgi:hypothetical protein
MYWSSAAGVVVPLTAREAAAVDIWTNLMFTSLPVQQLLWWVLAVQAVPQTLLPVPMGVMGFRLVLGLITVLAAAVVAVSVAAVVTGVAALTVVLAGVVDIQTVLWVVAALLVKATMGGAGLAQETFLVVVAVVRVLPETMRHQRLAAMVGLV